MLRGGIGSDTLNGESSGKGGILARDALKGSGKLHSPGGNVLVVALPAGYGATTDRLAGFKKAQAHTAMADIHESIEELAYYREHLLSL